MAGKCNIAPITLFSPSSNSTAKITLTAAQGEFPTIHHKSWLGLRGDVSERDGLIVVMTRSNRKKHRKSKKFEECCWAEKMSRKFEKAMRDTETWKRWCEKFSMEVKEVREVKLVEEVKEVDIVEEKKTIKIGLETEKVVLPIRVERRNREYVR